MYRLGYHVIPFTCTILLAALLYRTLKATSLKWYESRIAKVFLSSMVYSVFDGLWRIFASGAMPGFMSHTMKLCVLYGLTAILNLTAFLAGFMWFKFITTFFDAHFAEGRFVKIISVIPFISVMVFVAINRIDQRFFRIDDDLIYSNTELTYITYLPILVFYLIPFMMLVFFSITKGRRDNIFKLVMLFVIAVIPLAGGFIQMKHPQLPYVAGGFFVACVLMYSMNLTAAYEEQLSRQKEAAAGYSRELEGVIKSLSQDFFFVATINISTEQVVVHKMDDSFRKGLGLDGSVDLTRADSIVKYFTAKFIHREDRDRFIRSVHRENILKHLSKELSYAVDFRMKQGQKTTYCQIKIMRDANDENRDRILCGAYSVDEAMRREIRQKNQLDSALKKAERANSAKSDFLSRMAHDIRTPLNGMIGMIEIAKRNASDPSRIRECMIKIEDSSQHLISLVNDVLDMTKIESDRVEIVQEPFDMMKCLDNCSSVVEGQLYDRDLSFTCEFSMPDHRMLLGDELHLRRIFINLLGNAIKFTPDGGNIIFRAYEIKATKKMATFRFEVEDTGCGMSPEFIEHVWEPFMQEHSDGRSKYEGTGLGMAISKSLVEMMGGTIAVTSKPGEGSKFTVNISFNIDYEHLPEPSVKQTITTTARVLLVEDNELNREVMLELLGSDEIRLETAENGQIAVDKFLASEPGYYDAILMDIMMPVMDGCEAARCIRASGRPDSDEIPIIALTANAFEEDKKRTLEAGMNDHLTKPIDIGQTVRVLTTLINKRREKLQQQ